MADTYDVVSAREFAAPVEKVWRARHCAAVVVRWWEPYGFTSPQANLDFRVGGRSLACMPEAGGQDLCNTWTYCRIEPASLLDFDLALPTPPGPPGLWLRTA